MGQSAKALLGLFYGSQTFDPYMLVGQVVSCSWHFVLIKLSVRSRGGMCQV